MSVVTISELRRGVPPRITPSRALRLKTLEAARRLGAPLVIDEPVADAFGLAG